MHKMILALAAALTLASVILVVESASPNSLIMESNGWKIEIFLKELLTFNFKEYQLVGAVAVGVKPGEEKVTVRYNLDRASCAKDAPEEEKVIVLTSPGGHEILGSFYANQNEQSQKVFDAICGAIKTARMIPIPGPSAKTDVNKHI